MHALALLTPFAFDTPHLPDWADDAILQAAADPDESDQKAGASEQVEADASGKPAAESVPSGLQSQQHAYLLCMRCCIWLSLSVPVSMPHNWICLKEQIMHQIFPMLNQISHLHFHFLFGSCKKLRPVTVSRS